MKTLTKSSSSGESGGSPATMQSGSGGGAGVGIVALCALLGVAAYFQLNSNNKVEKHKKIVVTKPKEVIEHQKRKEERMRLTGSTAPVEGEEESIFDKAEREGLEKANALAEKTKINSMKTYVKIPSKLPKPDPEWIIKRFKGQSLQG